MTYIHTNVLHTHIPHSHTHPSMHLYVHTDTPDILWCDDIIELELYRAHDPVCNNYAYE